MVYLNSVKNFFATDNSFLWNFGIAKTHVGEYKEAEESFLAIKSETFK